MYARALLLRNCGHYTMVRSDLGSEYTTCRFLSEESLYAGLTREETRQFGRIEVGMSAEFSRAYDIPKRPIWFTPGMFVDFNYELQNTVAVDRMKYNVIDEAVPSTNRSTVYDKKGNRTLKERNHTATFGAIESVLPDQTLLTIGVSPDANWLSGYQEHDVFLMGKKRTMFEIVDVSNIVELQEDHMQDTVPTQVTMGTLNEFHSYTIHDINARYFLVHGQALKVWRMEAELGGRDLIRFLPDHFIHRVEALVLPTGK